MPTLSGCTLARNAVMLDYPLEASILTYLPICDEVVVAFDPDSEDETESLLQGLVRRHPKIRLVPSKWDLANHRDGTEIAIQSNVAIDACTSDWILYVQADEAIHEGDHDSIMAVMGNDNVVGGTFGRRSFLCSLDREVPEYHFRGLLRLFRNGEAYAIDDATTCGLVQTARGQVVDHNWRMFNYSRMGERDDILLRSRYRDNFHHDTEAAIEENLKKEFTQTTCAFEVSGHPIAIREHYQSVATSQERPVATSQTPVTLAVLMGPDEIENIAPFFWQFRGWSGNVVVIEDVGAEHCSTCARHIASATGLAPERIFCLRHEIGGDFSSARNCAQMLSTTEWVLHADMDELWDPGLVKGLTQLVEQLDRDGKAVCGLPRANYIDGVLVNDVPDSVWTTEGLAAAASSPTSWPPCNRDIQYRLLRKNERWVGRLHEMPEAMGERPDQVCVLQGHWILHSKTIQRQRRQTQITGLGGRRVECLKGLQVSCQASRRCGNEC